MPSCDDTQWESVRVPHDWAIAGPFDPNHDRIERIDRNQADVQEGVIEITGRTGGLPHVGRGWYRLWLEVPAAASPKCYRLECDGIMSNSQVYCNGEHVGGWPYGYTSFALDLTGAIKPGAKNLIAVSVENKPNSSRWYPGAGIYRNVRLVELEPIHIDHFGIEITTPEISDAQGQVRVVTRVAGLADGAQAVVRSTILDPAGHKVVSAEAPAAAATEQMLTVATPQRWSLETPQQYTLLSEIVVAGQVSDSLGTRFGFRTLRFDVANGFFLNEQPLTFKGVCLHHDLGPLGAAMNSAALRRQLVMLKDMGCNAIRTSHNPPDPELPAMASEMGMLVVDESFDEWKYPKCPNGYNTLWDEWAEKDLRALIKRDRNHPAVIMWSTGNEVPEQREEDGAEISQFLVDICHDEDPTRPVTQGMHKYEPGLPLRMAPTLDILGYNYKPHQYGQIRQMFPDKPVYGAETASTVSSRGVYYFPAEDEVHVMRDTLQVNSYDMTVPRWATSPDVEFAAQDAHPFVMGEFVWTGFDYLGEPTPYQEQWPSRSSYFGIIDLAGIPKDRFYLYQSRWSTDQNVLHLLPHWTWPGHDGQPIPVHCYTSYAHVELFVNGRSVGKQSRHGKGKVLVSNYRFHWPAVPYEPGELKVVATDKEGTVLAETVVLTAGEPAAIELRVDREVMTADGDDMVFVTVRMVDSQGVLVPDADHTITYTVDGSAELVGLCNGDATSLESFVGTSMRLFNGMAVAYVRARDGEPGDVTITARAEGLPAATLSVVAAAKPA